MIATEKIKKVNEVTPIKNINENPPNFSAKIHMQQEVPPSATALNYVYELHNPFELKKNNKEFATANLVFKFISNKAGEFDSRKNSQPAKPE